MAPSCQCKSVSHRSEASGPITWPAVLRRCGAMRPPRRTHLGGPAEDIVEGVRPLGTDHVPGAGGLQSAVALVVHDVGRRQHGQVPEDVVQRHRGGARPSLRSSPRSRPERPARQRRSAARTQHPRRRPVGNAQASGVATTALGNRRQQRSHALPQVVRNEISTHPHGVPTKIAKCKIADSAHFERLVGTP